MEKILYSDNKKKMANVQQIIYIYILVIVL